MKKIGICACYNTQNYGSMLQSFAMQAAIERMGYDWAYSEIQSLHAFSFLPIRAEPLYLIAKHWYEQKKYDVAYLFISRAYQLPFPKDIRLFINPSIYEF